jgi:two-component system, NtrC family, response regulator HydG
LGLVTQAKVLIVDDDRDVRETVGRVLSIDGHACELAADAPEALRIVDEHGCDAVVSDVLLEGMSGLDLLDRLRRSHPAVPFILVTGDGGVPQAVDAIKRGAFQYLVKPYEGHELRRLVRDALETRSPASDRRSVPSGVGRFDLIGTGPAMRALQTAIDFVSRSSAPVLVSGETGVGKELVARAIHARGARSGHRFVPVNTSAIPQELLEGELFGHVRGGFTGAVQARKGLLTEADGGTLLLDEIGDMPLGLQAKLLRVLQFGEVRAVGADRSHPVDARVVACTHRDLRVLVEEGSFREDLYFRLNVLPVFVPPLRQHREDIPELAAHFLAEALQRAPSSPVRAIGPEAMRMLTESAWPGNVRELASTIERAIVFGVDETLQPDGLAPVTMTSRAPSWPSSSGSPWTLRRLNRAYADWVVAEAGGDKERAAKILGIDLSTLYRWRRARRD